jgi:NTP pyrophosphatase (non-canonical NTP hydrolase)
VHNHAIHVFNRIQELLVLDFIKYDKARSAAIHYFSHKYGRYTRAELLLFSSLFHDLGKTKTLTTSVDKTTSAPGHEKKGVEITHRVLEKLHFNVKEITYISTIVNLHSGYSLRFWRYLMCASPSQLKTSLGTTYFLPEIALYMIADNESARTFSEYKKFLLNTILQSEAIYASNTLAGNYNHLDTLIHQVMEQLKTTSKPWTLEIRLLHLSEEVGELHDIYVQYLGAKDQEQTLDDIKNALTDVLLEILAIYNSLGISVTQALRNEIKENEKRFI